MIQDRRLNNLIIYGITILYAAAIGYLLTTSMESGKNKTLYFVILVPLFIVVLALLPRIRIQTMVGTLLLIFWLPAGFENWVLYVFEILLYIILCLVIIEYARSDKEKVKSYLNNFPWPGFVLYIVGALLTWFYATKIGGELNIIRAMCILPLALSIVFFLTIRSTQDAERFLWVVLTSAAILGLLFLVGEKFSGFISSTSYAAGSGRLSLKLSFPRVGSLEILPQSAANWFGFLLVFAFSIWIFHPSFWRRTYGLFLCLLYGAVVISSQGRGGAIQAASGALLVSAYAAFRGKIFGIRGIWVKFAMVCLVVIGGFWYLSSQSTNASYYQHGMALFTNLQGDENLIGRFKNWSNGIQMYLDSPILGIGLSGIQTPWGLDTSEILNYFLFNLLSYGLIGFIGLMLILSKLLFTFLKGIRLGDRITSMMCIASIGAMLGFFFGVQPEEPYSTVIVWAPLLISFATAALQENPAVIASNSTDGMNKFDQKKSFRGSKV